MGSLKSVQKSIDKYLANYAEAEIQSLQLDLSKPYDALCVIPVYDEPIDRLNAFLTLSTSKHIAFIWVFNAPEGGEEVSRARTEDAFCAMINKYACRTISEQIYLTEINTNIDLYMVNRCTADRLIPKKQGVGLARKIGLDLALSLSLSSSHSMWLHCCDADVSLPEAYFDIAAPQTEHVAALYPFRHCAERGYEEAMMLYDFKLRYYRKQLELAGSPYAFHTIGSTIAVTPSAYAQVRGMPKRSGGEDFYFLNKLAKIGNITLLEEPVLDIAGRPSHRVPFGTGPALVDIASLSDAAQAYRFYHPEIFICLKTLLLVASEAHNFSSLPNFYSEIERSSKSLTMKDQIIEVLTRLGFNSQFEHFKHRDDAQLVARFHTWFDAFVTLKFVHAMRETYYPSQTLDELPDHVKVGHIKHFKKVGCE